MVVGHQHRYKNSRIVTVPEELASDDDSPRLSNKQRLTPGVELTWFLLEIEDDELLKEDADAIKLLKEDADPIKVPGFSYNSKNGIRTKLRGLDRVSNVLNIDNNTRCGSDVREHDGTTVLTIPHRLTPEYTVTEGHDPWTVEQKKKMDQYRVLADDALIGPKDDIVFVADRHLTGASAQGQETIYLLFDWESLDCLSEDYYDLAFADTQDVLYVTDVETSGEDPNESYHDVLMRVIDYTY